MVKPLTVRAESDYRLYIEFSDGAEGKIDLSDLVGQGVFEAWRDAEFFRKVRLGPGRRIRWGKDIELCPDALYMRLTGKSPDEVFPSLRRQPSHA